MPGCSLDVLGEALYRYARRGVGSAGRASRRATCRTTSSRIRRGAWRPCCGLCRGSWRRRNAEARGVLGADIREVRPFGAVGATATLGQGMARKERRRLARRALRVTSVPRTGSEHARSGRGVRQGARVPVPPQGQAAAPCGGGRRGLRQQACLVPVHARSRQVGMRVERGRARARLARGAETEGLVKTEGAGQGEPGRLPSVLQSTFVMAVRHHAVRRLTGFVRTWAMAFALGEHGAWPRPTRLRSTSPNMLYELVAGGILTTAFLPVYLSVKNSAATEAPLGASRPTCSTSRSSALGAVVLLGDGCSRLRSSPPRRS